MVKNADKCLEKFGDRLQYLIKLRGISARQLAKISGVSERSMWNYINGKSLPNLKATILMAETLDTSVNYLVGTDFYF